MKASPETATAAVAVVSDLDALALLLAEKLGTLTSYTEQESYWTAEQAAAYIAASKQRIYDLHSQGRLHCVKDGSRLLTKRTWLDAYVEGES